MLYVSYEEAVAAMRRGLAKLMPEETAQRFAEIFAGNSFDGVHSHGMNRYPRYIADIKSGLCDASVTQAERVSGLVLYAQWAKQSDPGTFEFEADGARLRVESKVGIDDIIVLDAEAVAA